MKKVRKLAKPRNFVAKHMRKVSRPAVIPAAKGRGSVYSRKAKKLDEE